jgi:16S rRNA (uracil1498-N3)-methyltransferase
MRCYAPAEQWLAGEIRLDEEETHHLLHVMRAREGEEVEAFDGAGRVAVARVHSARAGEARLRVVREERRPPPPVRIVLMPCLIRESKMDLLIQKATELGAGAIHPVEAERSVVRLRVEQRPAKRERWRKIALHAAKQCGAAWLPAIEPPVGLMEALRNGMPAAAGLFGALTGAARPLREAVQAIRQGAARSVAFVAGPEGDLAPSECAALVEAGFQPVSLGPLVLRAETAALYALSVLQYEWGYAADR